MWSELSSKSGPICFQKLVRVSSKRAPSCLYKVVRADLKMGPILHEILVRIVLEKWSKLSSKIGPSCLDKVVRTDLKVAKNGSDFTLNNDPSCPGKVVRVVFTEWSELT